MGTPDTWLAQDGHYALPARILKAAGSAPPINSMPLTPILQESAAVMATA
jgi:hypothetical protein